VEVKIQTKMDSN